VDGLGELPGAPGAAAELAEDLPGLELGVRALAGCPFASLEALHQAMIDVVQQANETEQLALLRAHPDLGTRARVSDASTGEQQGAGLDRLGREEYARLQRLNDEYRGRFGFPFLFAVKGSTKEDVLAALEARPFKLKSNDELAMVSVRLDDTAGCCRSVVPPAATFQPPAPHVPLPTLLTVTDTFRLTASLRAKVMSDISSKATLRMFC